MATKVTDLPAVTQPFISSDNLLVSKHVTITSGLLTIGEEYTILDFNTGDNFSNVANVISGTINTTGCVFTATGTTPTTYSNGSTLAYYQSQKASVSQIGGLPKVYKALLTQTGTSAPVVVSNGTGANTPLVNTLSGTPTLLYDGVGNYRVQLTGEFTVGKTFMLIGVPENNIGLIKRSSADDDINNLYLYTLLVDGTTFSNDILNCTILIEVYP